MISLVPMVTELIVRRIVISLTGIG